MGPWMITLDVSIFDDVINNSENRNLCNELTRARLSLASGGDHNNIPIINIIMISSSFFSSSVFCTPLPNHQSPQVEIGLRDAKYHPITNKSNL